MKALFLIAALPWGLASRNFSFIRQSNHIILLNYLQFLKTNINNRKKQKNMAIQQQQMQIPSTIAAVTAAAVATYIIFKKFKKHSRPDENNFRWSFSNEFEMVGAGKIKYGYGVQNIQRESFEKFVYLCIQQKAYKITNIMYNWDLSNLNRLFLRDNNIQSVQQLNRIKMPNLQIIVLSDNKITEIKSLRRLQASNIIWIELQNNPICQKWDSLTQMNHSNLLYLWVQFFGNDKPNHDDIRWLAKCQSNILEKFHASGNRRIYDESCINTFLKKFNKLDIRTHKI